MIKLLFWGTGGLFAGYQYFKNNRYIRLENTPILFLTIQKKTNNKLIDDELFYTKFVNLAMDEDTDYYLYEGNHDITSLEHYYEIDIVSNNNINAYNVFMSFKKKGKFFTIKPFGLKKVNSHYSVTKKDISDDILKAGSTCSSQDYFENHLKGHNVYLTYQNRFFEKFVDVFELTDHNKYKKISTKKFCSILGIPLLLKVTV